MVNIYHKGLLWQMAHTEASRRKGARRWLTRYNHPVCVMMLGGAFCLCWAGIALIIQAWETDWRTVPFPGLLLLGGIVLAVYVKKDWFET